MRHFIESIQAFAMAIGGPGLALVAFLDASFLSIPQANDVLVVLMTVDQPARMPYYAGMAVAGSLAGCLVLFFIGRRGGEAALRGRFRTEHVERAMRLTRRYGLLATLVTSMLPPPTPFKLFVLMAGVGGMSTARFSLAVVAGRGLRYFGIGLLALWYGEAALDYLALHGGRVALGLVALVLAGAGWVWWRRRLQARRERGPSNDSQPVSKRPV